MVQATAEQERDRTIPEDTIVAAKLDDVKLETVEYVNKEGKPDSFQKLIWWFKITDTRKDGLYEDRIVRGETGLRLTTHPANNFRNWSEALLGREIEVGDSIDTDDLLGLPCSLSVTHATHKGKTYENVDVVLPASGGAGGSPARGMHDDDVPF